jgi:hypothetical protein
MVAGLLLSESELVGVTESTVTLALRVADSAGSARSAQAPIEIDAAPADGARGERISLAFEGHPRTNLVRVEGLSPGTGYRLTIRVGGRATDPVEHFLPDEITTLPAPPGKPVATFATLNDCHFGEPLIGGTLTDDMEYGDEAPGYPLVRAEDTQTPYASFMNQDAVAEINRLGVDRVIVKGDIADSGLPEQFGLAAETFARLDAPHDVVLGNHDYLARNQGEEVDGYGLLGQAPAPKVVELAGWRLLLVETADPGQHAGVFGGDRRAWLADALADCEAGGYPALLVMHHQPVPPEFRNSYPNVIGLAPDDSTALFELIGSARALRGVLIGHTHRNKVRLHSQAGPVPFIETHNSKDFPGGFGHYRLYEDGHFRQEMCRTGSVRALEHSDRCRQLFGGGYRRFTLGSLAERSLCVAAGRG